MNSDGLLIAQISDTHLSGAGTDPNLERLDRVLAHLAAMRRLPDVLLVTGDLVDPDEPEPYRMLRERLERCPFPFFVAIGNHDSASAARQAFEVSDPRFFQYVVETFPLRLVVLDTTEPGRHGGAFCEARSAWLSQRLDEAPERPTLLVLHHPPIDTGIDWLTTSLAEPWLARLDLALSDQDQIVGMVGGHIHRAIASSRNDIPVRVCPAVASPLVLDVAPLDPNRPDGRPLVSEGPPGYALHLWQDGVLTTHVGFVQDEPVLARFDERMQPQVRSFFAERP